jgi:hypothetical protein
MLTWLILSSCTPTHTRDHPNAWLIAPVGACVQTLVVYFLSRKNVPMERNHACTVLYQPPVAHDVLDLVPVATDSVCADGFLRLLMTSSILYRLLLIRSVQMASSGCS